MQSNHDRLVLTSRISAQTVEENTVFYFRSLSLDDLKSVIRDTFRSTDRGVLRTTNAIRERLLPALLVLRERTEHGEWENFLKSIGLSAATVRQWRHRERVATREIAQLLGEQPKRRQLAKPPICETQAQALAAAGARLAKSVLGSNLKYARRLAADYLEAYAAAA